MDIYTLHITDETRCDYFLSLDDLECDLAVDGILPPLENPTNQITGRPNPTVQFYPTGDRFYLGQQTRQYLTDLGGRLGPGQKVTIGGFTYEHLADGTVRILRGTHWAQVDPTGQYSSDSFTP